MPASSTLDEQLSHDEYAIEVSHVSKHFLMHADRRDSLKERFVRGSSKDSHVFRALDDVSFKVRKGATFGLIGHNGSGKSTMLKILAGVYRPSRGKVLVSSKVDALLEVGAGFHGELTGRENIYLNGSILGRSRKQIDDSLDWIIDFADIGSFIDEPVKVYSSGMTVRLGFAAAVAIEPSILIVDEIIAVGDEEFQRKCFDLMRSLRERGTTIALVTHSLSIAKEMCDEVVWLDHGRVRMTGGANEVISAYLRDVNARENEKRVSDVQDSAQEEQVNEREPELDPEDPYRFNQGTGQARVTNIEFLDRDGKVVKVLEHAERTTIRVHVLAREALQKVELGFSFVTDGGVGVAGPNSRAAGVLYDLPEGNSYIDFTLDPLPLLAGHFWLTVALLSGGTTYDFSADRFEMLIRDSGVMDEPGLVVLPPGIWSPAAVVSEKGGTDVERA